MAEIIPLPYSHRLDFIDRQARRAASMNHDAAERFIRHQINTQRETMVRKGIHSALVKRELKSLESGLRAALWRAVMRVPGAE